MRRHGERWRSAEEEQDGAMRVEETELPGVGRKFTVRTSTGDELVIVVHHSGWRQLLLYEGSGPGDLSPVRISLVKRT